MSCLSSALCLVLGHLAASFDEADEVCELQVQSVDGSLRIARHAPVPSGSQALLEMRGEFWPFDAVEHQEPRPAPSTLGHVEAVYSFAAPPLTQQYQVLNGRRADGVFPGLRVWVRSPEGRLDVVTRASLWYRHPKMVSLRINVGNANGSITLGNFSTLVYSGSTTKFDPTVTETEFLPSKDPPCVNFNMCHLDFYWLDYARTGQPELELFHRFCKDTEDKWPLELSKREARLRGYRMIGRARIPPRDVFNMDRKLLSNLQQLLPLDVQQLLENDDRIVELQHLRERFDDHDSIHLYQHEASLECVLAFEGSDMSLNDWTANLRLDTNQFCGFPEVHHGLGDKLRHQTRSLPWFVHIETKLPTCANVTVTGHSQGGALAELFAACVNRATVPDETFGQADYAALSWTPSIPRLREEIA